ncbi:hypothetical protein C9I98_07040 [Photobacterium sanctipauli]|uniref:Uncharacterized protein n=1 Tax=Photobacterium sanctipauli TaxID=1342794 RepID=A0A2T3NWE0_9GAMM|nr:hypothetical protein C9I98_07040 [Photobacterium sanctipauli]
MLITNGMLGVLAALFFFIGPFAFSVIVIIEDYYSISIGGDIRLLAYIVASVQTISFGYLLWNTFRKKAWLS